MDAAATVENAPVEWRTLGTNVLGVSHSRLENAARFPQRPQAPVLLQKTNQEQQSWWKEGFVSGGYGKRLLGSGPFKDEADRFAPLATATTAFPTASYKNWRERPSFVVEQTRFGLGSVGHVSENPWVMILKNHRSGVAQ